MGQHIHAVSQVSPGDVFPSVLFSLPLTWAVKEADSYKFFAESAMNRTTPAPTPVVPMADPDRFRSQFPPSGWVLQSLLVLSRTEEVILDPGRAWAAKQ